MLFEFKYVPLDPNDFERVHRIELSYTDKVKSIIVKFRSWKGIALIARKKQISLFQLI